MLIVADVNDLIVSEELSQFTGRQHRISSSNTPHRILDCPPNNCNGFTVHESHPVNRLEFDKMFPVTIQDHRKGWQTLGHIDTLSSEYVFSVVVTQLNVVILEIVPVPILNFLQSRILNLSRSSFPTL